jgi:LysM repeat protein
MPTSHANPIARVVAVIAIATAFILVIVVIATSGGSGGGDNGGTTTKNEKRSRAAREALREGEYEVERGDTLVSISDKTGVPVEVLTQLNPDIDPRILPQGTRIKLR